MTIKIGYFIPQDQYSPNQLLKHAILAEKNGFDSLWSCDHFHPWAHTKAHCGFSWVWLAAAGERTKNVKIGTAVTTPTFRYNPAIVAQAFATLAVIYKNRVFIGLGTGEAMNEIPVGYSWPKFKERAERLEEAIKIIKLLWTKDFVNFKGKYYNLHKANLYTKPNNPIPIYIASSGPTIAELAGRCADGYITLPFPSEKYKNVLFPAVEKGAKSVDRDPNSIEKILELHVSYHEDFDNAVASCRFWAASLLSTVFKYGVYDPREIEEEGKMVGDKQLAEWWSVGTNPEFYIKKIEDYIKIGFTNIHVQSSSPDERKFIRMFGDKVIPYFNESK
jgi:coenzyme F420-dependent glucose-6-phosphate dehydrogenase